MSGAERNGTIVLTRIFIVCFSRRGKCYGFCRRQKVRGLRQTIKGTLNEFLDDGPLIKLMEDFTFTDAKGRGWIAPSGFTSDGAASHNLPNPSSAAISTAHTERPRSFTTTIASGGLQIGKSCIIFSMMGCAPPMSVNARQWSCILLSIILAPAGK